jgi:hypothetical protein
MRQDEAIDYAGHVSGICDDGFTNKRLLISKRIKVFPVITAFHLPIMPFRVVFKSPSLFYYSPPVITYN